MIGVSEANSSLIIKHNISGVYRPPVTSELVRTIRISSYVDDQVSVDFDDVVVTKEDIVTVTTNDDGALIITYETEVVL